MNGVVPKVHESGSAHLYHPTGVLRYATAPPLTPQQHLSQVCYENIANIKTMAFLNPDGNLAPVRASAAAAVESMLDLYINIVVANADPSTEAEVKLRARMAKDSFLSFRTWLAKSGDGFFHPDDDMNDMNEGLTDGGASSYLSEGSNQEEEEDEEAELAREKEEEKRRREKDEKTVGKAAVAAAAAKEEDASLEAARPASPGSASCTSTHAVQFLSAPPDEAPGATSTESRKRQRVADDTAVDAPSEDEHEDEALADDSDSAVSSGEDVDEIFEPSASAAQLRNLSSLLTRMDIHEDTKGLNAGAAAGTSKQVSKMAGKLTAAALASAQRLRARQKSDITTVQELHFIVGRFAAVNSVSDLGTATYNCLHYLCPHIELFGLYLVDSETGDLVMPGYKGFTQQERDIALKTAMERHPGHVMKSKRMLLVNDALKDAKVSSSKRTFSVRSRLWIPICSKACPDLGSFGALGLASSQPYAFTKSHIRVLTLLGSMIEIGYAALYGRVGTLQMLFGEASEDENDFSGDEIHDD